MPDVSPFKIELDEFNVELPKIKTWRIDSDYHGSGRGYDSFQVTFIVTDGDRIGDPRIAEELLWERVTISVNGRPYLLGRIEWSDVGQNASELQIGGFDYRHDLARSDCDPETKVNENITLERAMLQVVQAHGINAIRSDGDVRLRDLRTGRTLTTPTPSTFLVKPIKEYAPRDNERRLIYIRRLASRHRVTVQPGANRGELVLASPNYGQEPSWTLVRYRETGNSLQNVLTSHCRRDLTEVPTYVQRDGQTNAGKQDPTDIAGKIKFKTAAGLPPTPPTPDPTVTIELDWPSELIPRERAISQRIKPSDGLNLDVGAYRPFFVRDTDSKNSDQLNDAMLRSLSERLKNLFLYECTVLGHTQDGSPYAIDTMADVFDEVCGVSQRLWIEHVSMSGDASGGTETQLKLRTPGTYIF